MKCRPLMVTALSVASVVFVLTNPFSASADQPGHYRPAPHAGSTAHHNLYVIAANGAAITTMPASDAEIVAELEESTRVKILDTASFTGSTFYYVEVLGSGSRGWISSNLVQPAR